MQAIRPEEATGPKRHRLLHGPAWKSPLVAERAALQRVSRSRSVEFKPSRSVVLVAEAADAEVFDLTARRAERAAADAERAKAQHPSHWQPA